MKPLSAARKKQAIEIAASDKRLKTLFKGRSRVILVEPNLHDAARPEGAEQVVVGVYDYAKNRSVLALVDPKSKAVVGVEDAVAQPQLSDEEKREAAALAAANERVDEFVAGREPNPLTRLYFPPGASDAPHRYAIVFVRPTNSERRYAIVDLSEQVVIDVLDKLTG